MTVHARPSNKSRCRRGLAVLSVLAGFAGTTTAYAQEAPGGVIPVERATDGPQVLSTLPTTIPATTTVSAPSVTLPAPTLPTVTLPGGQDMPLDRLQALLPTLRPVTDTAEMAQLADRYGSLSSTLVAFYAQSSGQTLGSFVAGNGTSLSSAFGGDFGSLHATSFDDLNKSLVGMGVTADPRDGNSMAAYASDIGSHASSIEAAVVGSDAHWALDMATFRMASAGGGTTTPLSVAQPSLTMPKLPSGGEVPGLPAGALMFGLLADRSVTAMVNDHPDLFAQVRSSGVGTAASASAWRSSMVNALAASQADFTAALPSPCHATMLTAMASGDPGASKKAGGSGCGGCLATGLYLHGQMSRLFDPAASTIRSNTSDNLLPPAEFNQLQPWQRNAIANQNPQLAAGLSGSLQQANVPGCGGAAAVSATAGASLPGVFATLGRR